MRYELKVPPDNILPDLRRYLAEETEQINSVFNQPTFGIIRLDVLQATPAKPRAGMVGYFAAGVATASEGIHRYSTGGSWIFVG